MRLAAVQFAAQPVADFAAFADRIDYFVGLAADYDCQIVCFPEFVSLALATTLTGERRGAEAVDTFTSFLGPLETLYADLARRHDIAIVGGTHIARTPNGAVRNIALLAHADGRIDRQEKIHPTPSERSEWGVSGGESVATFDVAGTRIAIATCYDVEFPELVRHQADLGARILFVPFCTDTAEGYARVRHCAQARAIENQLFVVMAGNVGALRGVPNMDIQAGQSAILTPCDLRFARDGVAAIAPPGVETMILADLRLDDLDWARTSGTVRTLTDRRDDLYRIDWTDKA